MEFQGAIRLKVGVEVLGEGAVAFGSSCGEEDEVAGEPVAERVEAGGGAFPRAVLVCCLLLLRSP